ncbi:YqaA family protein [Pseudoalteromonas sp. SSM20]|uniref:YqaA family protein n=1 Tax=unclassified Pseudoalteromonas TaxID=194690 RepID=UPI00237E2A1A|nr:YqaA family protein [Pseudoalteromonas sp. G4]MDE3273389.1 DedA family protein [Pseudoalteromonas sp. G4]
MSYLSLFFTAFIAATLLPTASEGMLAYLTQQQHNIALLWFSATLGNTLGSCVNWWLGKELNRFKDRKWFAVSEQQLEKAQKSFNRYGRASLLLAWLPIIGDPLTFVAGIMRVPFSIFVLLVAIGKALRYAIVIAMALQFF